MKQFFLLLFKYSCLHFHSTMPPLLSPPHLPPLNLLHPFGFVHVSFIHVPDLPPLHHLLLSLSLLLSDYCQIVLYFNVSGYILLASLFCWLSSTYRWGHMVFVFHNWLFSLIFPDPSMLLRRVGTPSFFLLCSIPLCKCTTVFGSTHLLMGP